MPILNYTTTVEAAKSIAEIQGILAKHGARKISTDFDDNGNVSGIDFIILIDGLPLAIRLPCDVEGVYRTLIRAKGVPRRSHTKLQARRVAWRILKDWIEAQLALYEVGQAELGQVLMPYAIDAQGRTAYDAFKEVHIKQLNAASDNVVEGDFQAAVNE
ncbi:MAG TPA: hypothetical protein VFX97_16680 [Pyrinomonadaceae bacterium]|nr:hypothetical protein [Pyrinomonadaceae bacterium]